MIKKITNTLILVTSTALLMALLACGGKKQMLISQADINNAKQSGTLGALFDKAELLKGKSKGSSKKELVQMQSQISQLLVNRLSLKIKNIFDKNKTEYQLVDRQNLLKLITHIDSAKKWDEVKVNKMSVKLNDELKQVNQEIEEANNNAKRFSKDLLTGLTWLKKSAILGGENSQEEKYYFDKKQSTINSLSEQGRDAFKRRMFNMALNFASKGLQLDSGNIKFESLLEQSEVALFEQGFRGALEGGKPELAYQALVDIADKPIMLQIKKKMERSILLLSNYFSSNAEAYSTKNELYKAYTEFKRGREIQVLLEQKNLGFIQERNFLDLLMNQASQTEINAGEKFALLSVIKELDPSYPELNGQIQTSIESISNRATTKLVVSEFKEVLSSNSVVGSVGRRVGSKLEKIIFEKLSGKLQVVTKLNENESSDYSGVSIAIDGEVLQAAIESSNHKGQKSINVLTAINKTETEEYIKWKRRERGEAPLQYTEEKIMEDITIKMEYIKKIAVAEVAYRIIEPSSQKVLLTNNLLKESNYQGKSTNEFQKGLFHQKYIEADLPSDIKIMDSLASQISDDLGEILIEYLDKPEVVFYKKYEVMRDKGLAKSAIELLSNAVVIGRYNSDNKQWLSSLKKLVLEK